MACVCISYIRKDSSCARTRSDQGKGLSHVSWRGGRRKCNDKWVEAIVCLLGLLSSRKEKILGGVYRCRGEAEDEKRWCLMMYTL